MLCTNFVCILLKITQFIYTVNPHPYQFCIRNNNDVEIKCQKGALFPLSQLLESTKTIGEEYLIMTLCMDTMMNNNEITMQSLI
jgi:hypothetical protein